MKITKNEIWFTIALIFLGIVTGMQIRANNEKNKKSALAGKQTEYYQNLINDEKSKAKKYKSEIEKYENENKALYDAYAYLDKEGAFLELNDTLKKTLKYAGMTDVKGPGIIITIDDADIPPEERAGMDASDFVIHDMDVIRFINELRKAGVQAISINDERIISTSCQVCAGPTIMINGRKYTTPYIIKGIGDSAKLKESLMNSMVYKEFVEYGLSIKLEESKDLLIKKYLIKKNEGATTNEKNVK